MDDPALPPPAYTTNSRVRNGIEKYFCGPYMRVQLSLLFVGWCVANAGFDTSENVYIENWLKLGLRRQMGRKIANIVEMFSL